MSFSPVEMQTIEWRPAICPTPAGHLRTALRLLFELDQADGI
jgi:hypothetical protein